MVNHCANPQCGKPLHYLRAGRVYVFDVTRYAPAGEARSHRMEHFWLCGVCSDAFLLEQTPDAGIQVSPRQPKTTTIPSYQPPQSIAS